MMGGFQLSQAKRNEAAAAETAATRGKVSAHVRFVSDSGDNVLAAMSAFHGFLMSAQRRLPTNCAQSLFRRRWWVMLLRRRRRLLLLSLLLRWLLIIRRCSWFGGLWLFLLNAISTSVIAAAIVVVIVGFTIVVVIIVRLRRF